MIVSIEVLASEFFARGHVDGPDDKEGERHGDEEEVLHNFPSGPVSSRPGAVETLTRKGMLG